MYMNIRKSMTLMPALLFAGFVASGQQPASRFVLKGNYKGKPVYIHLRYADKNGSSVNDSCLVQNGAFSFSGDISGPANVFISGNLKSRSVDDPNFTSFFLEPGAVTISLQENHFKEAVVKGSKTQDENKELEKKYEKVKAAYQKQLDSLKTAQNAEVADGIRERLAPYYNEMEQAAYTFFSENPQSYVTAYMLRFYVSRLSLDSLKMFYNRLGENLQNTATGKEIAGEIQKLTWGSPGSVAKDFTATDINGNKLALSDFKGKYVLLDFWASWCVPCRKGNPHLKELYAKYHDRGIEFIGVSDDDNKPEAWKKAVEMDGLPWRHVLRGLKYENNNFDHSADISENFGIHSLPTKILIDKDGVIIGRYGEEEQELDKKLNDIFN